MSFLQIYLVLGLPAVALIALAVAILLARRSARRVDAADAQVQRAVSERRRYLEGLAGEGVNGLEGKVAIAKANIVAIRRYGE
ncbi:hypothetical protein MKK88_17655 [Methylobacterium sp. E-005]|uniref:hypothetical protein n=1 Tax=Methylobacterium sp. E-005 TaxID=2836549 RepID=UPI001FBBA36C|nr:hypothetical protein [Methylobacterium sp. E-005]MCJ2087792.1 hypothetical protein [Methylobacterium sp. E-005]